MVQRVPSFCFLHRSHIYSILQPPADISRFSSVCSTRERLRESYFAHAKWIVVTLVVFEPALTCQVFFARSWSYTPVLFIVPPSSSSFLLCFLWCCGRNLQPSSRVSPVPFSERVVRNPELQNSSKIHAPTYRGPMKRCSLIHCRSVDCVVWFFLQTIRTTASLLTVLWFEDRYWSETICRTCRFAASTRRHVNGQRNTPLCKYIHIHIHLHINIQIQIHIYIYR